jgi:4-methyl-5(b-hydroxyethyl)-thiazole monophosphate biosynthesis
LLAGKRFTSHAGVANELPQSLLNERVVEDGNLITSRGAATAVDLGLALVRRLFGEEKMREVAKGIMA